MPTQENPPSFALCSRLSTVWRLYPEPLCTGILSSGPVFPLPWSPAFPHSPLLWLLDTVPSAWNSLTFLSPFPVITLPLQLPVWILVVFQGPAYLTSLLEALRWTIFPPHTAGSYYLYYNPHHRFPAWVEWRSSACWCCPVRGRTGLWSAWPP